MAGEFFLGILYFNFTILYLDNIYLSGYAFKESSYKHAFLFEIVLVFDGSLVPLFETLNAIPYTVLTIPTQ